jgi:hypothetical protein
MTLDDTATSFGANHPEPALAEASIPQDPSPWDAEALEPDHGGHFITTGSFEYLDELFPNTDDLDNDAEEIEDELEMELFWEMGIDLDAPDEVDEITPGLDLDIDLAKIDDSFDDESETDDEIDTDDGEVAA